MKKKPATMNKHSHRGWQKKMDFFSRNAQKKWRKTHKKNCAI